MSREMMGRDADVLEAHARALRVLAQNLAWSGVGSTFSSAARERLRLEAESADLQAKRLRIAAFKEAARGDVQ